MTTSTMPLAMFCERVRRQAGLSAREWRSCFTLTSEELQQLKGLKQKAPKPMAWERGTARPDPISWKRLLFLAETLGISVPEDLERP